MSKLAVFNTGVGILSILFLGACSGSANGLNRGYLGGDSLRVKSFGFRDLTRNASSDLIYASGTNGTVYVYSFPDGQPEGKLTGFDGGIGLCADSAGNVFIPSMNGSSTTVYEYPHGGNMPISSLNDPGAALGCAVDPNGGDLAVTNTFDSANPYGSQYGSVAIYRHAQGNPTLYYPSGLEPILSGYDNSGVLYLTAATVTPPKFELVRLDTESGNFQPIALKAKISRRNYFIPFVQWDGSHMTVSSNASYKKPVLVYQLSIAGNKATVIGTTTLQSKKNRHVGQSWIDGTTIAGNVIVKGQNNIALWSYPEGGKPAHQIVGVLSNNLGHLEGIVVSHASR